MKKCEKSEPMKKVYLRSFAKPSERKKSPECWMLLYFQTRAISKFADEFSGWVGEYRLLSWETARRIYRAALETRQMIFERGEKFLANVPGGYDKLTQFTNCAATNAACMAESFSIDEVNPAAYAWYDEHKDGFKTQDPVLKQWVHLAYQIHVLNGMVSKFLCSSFTCNLLTKTRTWKIANAVDRVIRCMDHKFPSYLYFSVPFDRDKTPDLFYSGSFTNAPYDMGAEFFGRLTKAFDTAVSESKTESWIGCDSCLSKNTCGVSH